jgi:predicted  nucleic acid-binding Zn-ribbon protein
MEKENEITSKCKNCGSDLVFNSKEGCLTCKYCKSNYFLPTTNDKAVLVRQYDAGFHPNQMNKTLYSYECTTCKNIYYVSSDEKSKKCPNCGNATSTLVQDSGYCADGILPFKITKEEAAKKLSEYLKSQGDVPNELKKMAANQKLMGVFIPVWNFSFTVAASYNGNAVELKKDFNGMFYSVNKPVFGDEVKRVESLDEAANSNEDPVFLDLFDENDYNKIIPYTPEYTYGYRVDAINKNIHDYYYNITSTAEKDMEKKITKKLNSKYKEIYDIQVDADARDVFFNFTYVPVYVNTYTHAGKTYKTYVSGTTGKVIGKTPRSAKKVIGKFLKGLAVVALIAAIGYLFLK